MKYLAGAGVTDLVSNLMDREAWSLGLEKEAEAAAAVGITFHRHPIPDGGIPVQPEFDWFIDTLVPVVRKGGFLIVHCLGGIGRSSTTVAAVLVRLGFGPNEAFRAISQARGFPVPETMEQYDFVMGLGKK
jgi:protein-tyrosine phosphatase